MLVPVVHPILSAALPATQLLMDAPSFLSLTLHHLLGEL